MRLAILYICTGKYWVFWEEFYQSSEKYFASNIEKTYFVFTDSGKKILAQNNIIKIPQKNLGWPKNTLLRYHMFHGIETELKDFDYVFFFNANCIFHQEVTLENVFAKKEIFAVQHPGYLSCSYAQAPLEKKPSSTAYLDENVFRQYVLGGILGASGEKFRDLINYMVCNIDLDLQENIIAIWHDESHWNKYVSRNDVNILSSIYGSPEEHKIEEAKIIIRDKNRYGGHRYLRNQESIKSKLRRFLKKVLNV